MITFDRVPNEIIAATIRFIIDAEVARQAGQGSRK